MSERKQQILQEALNILITQGYGALSMRAVARASGLKLGALQYHYKTRGDLVRALATWVTEETAAGFAGYRAEHAEEPELLVIVDYMLEDRVGERLGVDQLFIQLWAMALVEPAIRQVLDQVYEAYLDYIEGCLTEMGVPRPRADALVLMATLEGLGPLVGSRGRWEEDAADSIAALRAMLVARYPALAVSAVSGKAP